MLKHVPSRALGNYAPAYYMIIFSIFAIIHNS